MSRNEGDEDDVEETEEDYSRKTLEKAAAAKFTIQQYYHNYFRSLQEREQRYKRFWSIIFVFFVLIFVTFRRKKLEEKMSQLNYPESKREKLRKELDKRETGFIRVRSSSIQWCIVFFFGTHSHLPAFLF